MPHNVNQTKSGTCANKTNNFCEAESRCRWCGVCFQWVNSPLQPSSMVLGDTNIPRAWKTMENSDMNEWWEGQCNRNMSQTESLCIHLFQSTEVPFCLILQQIRAEIHLIWQWKRLNVNLSNHSDSDEWWSTKRPQSPRHQTVLALRLRRLKHFCGDERETLIHGVRNIFL